MEKSPQAFRTISEVSALLDLPAHVLRFWESRFPQLRPIKSSGGRRYYRPEDVELLRGIRDLLYDDGMTIKGVQKILREQGVRAVSQRLAGVALAAAGDPDAGPGPEENFLAAPGAEPAGDDASLWSEPGADEIEAPDPAEEAAGLAALAAAEEDRRRLILEAVDRLEAVRRRILAGLG